MLEQLNQCIWYAQKDLKQW